MKTKRILITLSLGYGINMMGFESSLTREQISVSNPELTVLSLREFCMLSKENLLRMDDMTPDKVAAIERLLAEYSLRLGMSDVELEAYLNRYYEENPKKRSFTICATGYVTANLSSMKTGFEKNYSGN